MLPEDKRGFYIGCNVCIINYGKTISGFPLFRKVHPDRLNPNTWKNLELIRLREDWRNNQKPSTRAKGVVKEITRNGIGGRNVHLVQVDNDFVAISRNGLKLLKN